MKKIGEKILCSGKWVQLKEAEFAAADGRTYCWEVVQRVNDTKGVVIIAELLPSHRIIFTRQYRQPLENYIIGFPAGLAEGDDLGQEAMRELLEETGYRGKVRDVGPLIRSNPGLLRDGAYTVLAEVDELDPQNQHPKQQLEVSEDIEIFLVPKEEARDFLLRQKEQGDDLGMGVWYMFGIPRV